MTKEQRLAYLPAYFDVLLTAAAMNHATFEEIDNWASCGVMMPPGYRVDNPFTLLQSGFISVLWQCGIGGCSVCCNLDFVICVLLLHGISLSPVYIKTRVKLHRHIDACKPFVLHERLMPHISFVKNITKL